MSRFATLALLALLACGSAGCGSRPGDASAPAESSGADATARAQALIEAGNAAYKAGQYQVAAKRYAGAAVSNPEDAAAYFGLGMSLARLGRDEEARVAYARARELSRRSPHP